MFAHAGCRFPARPAQGIRWEVLLRGGEDRVLTITRETWGKRPRERRYPVRNASHVHPPCCQQYALPGRALREQRVPFFVVAAHCEVALGFGVAGGFAVAAVTGAGAGVVVAGATLRIGGRQMLQGPYPATACLSAIWIDERRRYRHPAAWYFAPVLVT